MFKILVLLQIFEILRCTWSDCTDHIYILIFIITIILCLLLIIIYITYINRYNDYINQPVCDNYVVSTEFCLSLQKSSSELKVVTESKENSQGRITSKKIEGKT